MFKYFTKRSKKSEDSKTSTTDEGLPAKRVEIEGPFSVVTGEIIRPLSHATPVANTNRKSTSLMFERKQKRTIRRPTMPAPSQPKRSTGEQGTEMAKTSTLRTNSVNLLRRIRRTITRPSGPPPPPPTKSTEQQVTEGKTTSQLRMNSSKLLSRIRKTITRPSMPPPPPPKKSAEVSSPNATSNQSSSSSSPRSSSKPSQYRSASVPFSGHQPSKTSAKSSRIVVSEENNVLTIDMTIPPSSRKELSSRPPALQPSTMLASRA